jgi:hypothetical protein
LDRQGQWWNAEFSVLQDAVKDLWERFAQTPFTWQRLRNWLASQGYNRVDAGDMPLAEVRRMLEAELAAKQPAPPAAREVTEPLTDAQQAVYEAIRDLGPIGGKDICKQAGVTMPNLKNRILPGLRKKFTILSKPGAGYYLADS